MLIGYIELEEIEIVLENFTIFNVIIPFLLLEAKKKALLCNIQKWSGAQLLK